MSNTSNTAGSSGTYIPIIKRKRQQPRHAIRRLLRSFEPLKPPGQTPVTPQHSGGN